ncbi:hypothetical protein Poli38472_003986 [Pythium oligandrum]|uniref:CID domain-containing protein n=1 Tax=Pythium oligandrum TaxID=41045 RepID=A0A8K1CP74_PYTOL|nr:hypothetical protein Poli38472_003986 [Pythium oligandrum]|eukprot:TMW66221.1 hypothetical protein Poli38472_003986 [Pythium oligandrum]
MSDNWHLDVKFQGRSIALVGRLPAEKRMLLREFPKKLAVSTKVKLAAIPSKGFFCKFAAKHVEEMKVYMTQHECALCVNFVASTYNFTLYLIVPTHMKGLRCLHRLKKSGAPPESIKSLSTDREGVVIGFIVSEVNHELEEKMVEREKVMQELVSTAKALSSTFGDPMLEFDLLVDQLETKPSAIQICSKFIVKHQSLHDRIRQKLCETMDAFASSKGKVNVLFLVHDVIKSVRAGHPQEERNQKMRESPLVRSLEKILYDVVERIPRDVRHSSNVKAVFDFWKKWGLNYSTPHEGDSSDLLLDPSIAKLDESLELLAKEGNLSDASSSPVKQTASAEILDFMKRHSIQPGPWEVYLSRATSQEMDELDRAMTLNEDYRKYNRWENVDKGGRRTGEYFLHHYVRTHMPSLLLHSYKGATISAKRKRSKRELEIFKDAFLCTWDGIDAAARRAISDVERDVMDDIWRKMENEKCLNASAFVFGKIRRMKTIHFALNPEIDGILQQIADENNVKEKELIDSMVRVFRLDSMAREGLHKVKSSVELSKIAKELCDRCRERMVANPSVHVVKLCQKAIAKRNPRKAYSTAMKSMMLRQMKLAAKFDEASQKKRRLEEASSAGDASPQEDLTDAELAAVKKRIPKPPKLLFKKVDLSTITYQESNDNGTVGVAVSGIPNAGRGLFNLSDHTWPAFSVVCIFGVRRITKEEHHDGLNKVARCGELGETFVVVNGVVREVEKFQMQYGHRLQPFEGLVDADGSVGGFPNDRVYEYPADIYWDASSFYNNCILVPGCLIDPQDEKTPILLNQLYIVTWKEVPVREEFFLAYGTSYYEDDEKERKAA